MAAGGPPDYDSRVKPTVLVMAAGRGTRMRSSLPKVLHTICGRPMVAWPILAARAAGAERVAVIVSPDRDLTPGLPEGTEIVVQQESDGTGGAVRSAVDILRTSETVLVLSGDTPLVSADVVARLLAAHTDAGAGATVMTTEMDDPGSYGRIVRSSDGSLEAIVEAKEPGDATPEQLRIKEINSGTYAFDGPALADAVMRIGNDNAQGEYYLGDVLPLMREAGLTLAAHLEPDDTVTLGVNDRVGLALVETVARRRILEEHMLAGVTVADPASTWVDADVELAQDVTLLPGTSLRGATSVGAGSVIGPHSTLIDSTVGESSQVIHSHLAFCEVLDECTVGPFAYLRPDTVLRQGAKAGAFTEIKNSDIGAGSKVPHLSYVGDADIGEGSNLGAGTITANYDGKRKHRTVIGDHVRTGVDTMLVAPVEIGDSAYTGAGAVIREEVPPGSLAVSENSQRNIDGYAERKSAETTDESET